MDVAPSEELCSGGGLAIFNACDESAAGLDGAPIGYTRGLCALDAKCGGICVPIIPTATGDAVFGAAMLALVSGVGGAVGTAGE